MSERTAIGFLTQHGKEALVAPILEPAIDRRIFRVDSLDTDRLGTFTRDVLRRHSQLVTARRKARLAARLGGTGIGLGSEGAFIRDPVTGMLPWNVEVLVYYDRRSRLEVVARAHGPGKGAHQRVADWDGVLEFAQRTGFPEHRMVLRPEHEDHPEIQKGIGDWQDLRQAFASALQRSSNGAVFVEVDCRAHCNPTRQALIRKAAENLVARLESACPQCGVPGFWRDRFITGLPCETCAMPTREPQGEVRSCVRCEHRESYFYAAPGRAETERCDSCNP